MYGLRLAGISLLLHARSRYCFSSLLSCCFFAGRSQIGRAVHEGIKGGMDSTRHALCRPPCLIDRRGQKRR